MHQSKARRCLLEMLIEFQAVDEEALKAVGTSQVRPGRIEVRFFKLEKATDKSPQLKEATLENWELALIL